MQADRGKRTSIHPSKKHRYVYACTLTFLFTNMPGYMHTCIHAYMHTCMHAYIHTCIHTYLYVYVYIYIYAYTCTYTYTYTYTNVHLHIHIHTEAVVHMPWAAMPLAMITCVPSMLGKSESHRACAAKCALGCLSRGRTACFNIKLTHAVVVVWQGSLWSCKERLMFRPLGNQRIPANLYG